MSKPFKLNSAFRPSGDQPEAIRRLEEGLEDGLAHQTLLGVTGSGKTFTTANVIADLQRPTMVLAPTTITTSRKPMCRALTPSLRKMPQ